MFKVMRSLRSSKCLKTTVGLTFTTKKQALLVLGQLVLFSTGNTFFWINLVQKLKIISLSWNFVPRLIQICTIPWWCPKNQNPVKIKIWSKKIKIVSLSWNLVSRLIWIIGNQWWCSLFLFLTRKTLIGQIWSEKSKLSVKAEIWYQEINLNMRNSMMIFPVKTFSVFNRKCLFVQIWSKK